MKAPIVRLFVLIIVLFGVLIGFTSYWSVFAAEDLRANAYNHRDGSRSSASSAARSARPTAR